MSLNIIIRIGIFCMPAVLIFFVKITKKLSRKNNLKEVQLCCVLLGCGESAEGGAVFRRRRDELQSRPGGAGRDD